MVTLARSPHVLLESQYSGGGDIISDTIEQFVGGCFGVLLGFFFLTAAIVLRVTQHFLR